MSAIDTAAREAIADLHVRNAWALDLRDLERYLADFTDDAVFIETDPEGAERELRGRGAIRENARERFAGPSFTQHRMSQQLFAAGADRDGCTVWAYWSTSTCDPATGAAALAGSGWLRDELRRIDGHWLIAERRIALWTTPPTPPWGVVP